MLTRQGTIADTLEDRQALTEANIKAAYCCEKREGLLLENTTPLKSSRNERASSSALRCSAGKFKLCNQEGQK